MAPKPITGEDYAFLLLCLKHTPAKPDFDAVSKEAGMTNKQKAYKRHWDLMQKLGAPTAAPDTPKSTTDAASSNNPKTPTSGIKRGRPTKKEKEAACQAVEEGSEDGTTTKKAKVETGSTE